jgi:positive regulator of sigma E activity
MEYAEYDKYLVQQKGVLLSALVLNGVLVLGMLVFLLLSKSNFSAQWLALAEAVLCAACIFLAFRQYHALFEAVAIDEPISVRYDI